MYYMTLKGHSYGYEIYEIVSLYFPGVKIMTLEEGDSLPEEVNLIESSVEISDGKITAYCSMKSLKRGLLSEAGSASASCAAGDNIKKSLKRCIKLSVFKLFRDMTGIEIPWGILVGIRPTKIVNDLKSAGIPEGQIAARLKEEYLLRDDKVKLVLEVSSNSYSLINSDHKNISVYIGIPFCPTRCIYCSFASYSLDKYSPYVKPYLDALIYEIECISRYVAVNGFRVETIYIGGGTPTSLNDWDFKLLLDAIHSSFSVSRVKEFTVEAGRPDTINLNKLMSMLEKGVNRISINPQSMNAKTLNNIGRNHTPEEIISKYNMARDAGFNNINMDMILGLPGETLKDVKYTLDNLISLSPENITVHTMAVKRASRLKEKLIEEEQILIPESSSVDAMMNLVYDTCHERNYIPYYMYRQKMMVGNLENVGYCKRGFECLYNIQMIEEKQTIIGLGADAVTKAVFLRENRIERFANKKDIKTYIDTIEENTEKKLRFLDMLTEQ